MKRWLIPVAIVALMIVGATAGAFASGEKDRGSAFENSPPVSSDDGTTQLGCELGASECDDTPDTCEPVPLRSDCGIDPDECNFVHNISVCDQDDLDRLGEDSLPLVNPAGDKDTSCDQVPLRSDCGIAPNECNFVHNISVCDQDDLDRLDEDSLLPVDATGQYRVVVSYNTSVTQLDLDETAEFLRGFDADLEFLIQESWPPTGVANLQTDAPNFCDAIFDELASQSYITDFSCNPQQVSDGDAAPDAPVTNLPVAE